VVVRKKDEALSMTKKRIKNGMRKKDAELGE